MPPHARGCHIRRNLVAGVIACAAAASAVASAAVPITDHRQPAVPMLLQPKAAARIARQLPPPLAESKPVVQPPADDSVVVSDQLEYPASARKAWAVTRLLQPDEPRNPLEQPAPLPAPAERIPAGGGANPSVSPPTYGDTTLQPIGALTVNIVPSSGQVPRETDPTQLLEREFGATEFRRVPLDYCYFWESPAFFNQPLYFEQPNVERYGYDWGPAQPFISAAQFWVKIPLLPYMMAVHCPQEHVYSLGYYRPGSRVPYQINWPEVRLDAITVETAFITGLVFLIP